MTSPDLGQCGWINWVEEGGDGSACPEPATIQVRVFFDGNPLPVTAVFCDEHVGPGTEKLHPRYAGPSASLASSDVDQED